MPSSGWRRAFRLPASRRQVERELDDELTFHLAMRAEKLRAAGLSDADAAQQARRQFGDLGGIRGECLRIDRPQAARRRARSLVEDWRHDLVIAVRGLRRAPGFTAAAVLTFALGIGAATAVFSVAYGVLLRPLPLPKPGQLVQVVTGSWDGGADQSYLSGPEFVDLREAVPSLAHAAALVDVERTLTGAGQPERLRIGAASASLFPALGVRAAVGRVYRPDEDVAGVEPVVVLTHALWQRRFGGDTGVLGSAVRLSGRAHTVVGVLPAGVQVGILEAFVPLRLDPARLRPRGAHYLEVIARLRTDASIERARTELAALGTRSVRDHPESYADPGFTLSAVRLRDAWVGEARPTLLVLLGIVVLLLLLACVNVANLLLVRAEARQRELGVRVALGASRGRLVRQLLTETLVLAAIGALIGLPLAALAVRGLLALNPNVVPVGTSVSVDATVLLAGAGIVALTALLAGLVPALQASATDVRAAIAGGAVGGGRRGGRLRATLVAIEIAVALLVLVGAGLVGRSFWHMQQVDPGFAHKGVLTFDLTLAPDRPADEAQVPLAYAQLLERLRTLPGARAVAAVSHLPMGGLVGDWTVDVEGRPAQPGAARLSPSFAIASAGYLATLEIPVRAGRDFSPVDGPQSVPVVIASHGLADALWPGERAVGRRFRLGAPPDLPPLPWMEVIGVAGDVRAQGLAAGPRPAYYLLDQQFPTIVGGSARSMAVVVRTAGDPRALIEPTRRVISEFDPELAAGNVRPLSAVVAATVARPRFAAVVLVTFGAAALALAVIGVYGVLSYAVARRRREMGIRMALGASAGQVRGLVVASGLRLAAIGVTAGVALALAGGRLLGTLLYDVGAADPGTFAGAVLLLAGAVVAASYAPARRATRVDPAEALRPE